MFASKDLFLTRPSGYQISRSVRFRQSASSYFSRTPASASNRTTWTWSGWVKRGLIPISTSANGSALFGAGTFGANAQFRAYLFDAGIGTNTACIYLQETVYGVSNQLVWYSTAVLRDPSGWYHVVVAIDTTQATAANRVKVYLNGVALTGTFQTTPAQNQALSINNTVGHSTGAAISASAFEYLDGYLTEINFIDGQALTPSSFGQTNTVTGVWQPIKYTGTYGTNGFYLNFSDNSAATATTIGKDYSGNGNNWTPSAGISVTAGVTYDSMLDVPTLYADGGNGRGNYAVLNPLYTNGFNPLTLTNGNLTATSSSGARIILSTLYQNTGAYYFEATCTTVGTLTGSRIGIRNDTVQRYYDNSGNYFDGSSSAAYGATYTTGDVLGVAFDLTNQTITFYKNGTSQGQKTAIGLTGQDVTPFVYADTSGVWNANFGQRPFTYTPPTGFVALNTQNLPTPTISNGATVMAATLWTGDGTNPRTITNTVNGVSFQPDLVWTKARSQAYDHSLYDSVRGATNYLISNSTATEASAANTLQAFNSNGFQVGGNNYTNSGSATYVAWQWNAGGTSTNITVGQYGTSPNVPSIASTVRANATAGFSIVTYTGTGVAATIGHGLGVAPSMIITKPKNLATDWGVYHNGINDPSKALILDSTAAAAAYGGATGMWNNTAPTSTVFSVGNNGSTGGAYNYVAYCFAAVAGYSAFGSYTGNNSTDGPFVYLGFRPRFIMIKSTSAGTEWVMIDTARNSYNLSETSLYANRDYSESTIGTVNDIDILSNGFKLRNNTGFVNASQTYIYAAFAENPFKYSLAR